MEFEIATSGEHSYESLANRDAPAVQVVFKAAHDEMRRLIQQRVEITQRIGAIKQTIVGLRNLFGDNGLTDDLRELVNSKARRPGITEACRKALMEARSPLTARKVSKQLQQATPDLRDAKNLVAEVTTVLSRLAQYGEARTVPCDNGSRAWVWVSQVEAESFQSVVPAALSGLSTK